MNRYLVVTCMIIMSIFSALAQNDMEIPKQGLIELGFENVRIYTDNDTVYAALEDPSYRGTFRGPAKALECLALHLPNAGGYELVVEEYGDAKVCVHASKHSAKWNVNVDYKFDKVLHKLASERGEKSPYMKIDVSLVPIISLNNHKYDMLFETGIFFAPFFSTSLWKGNRVTVQPIIPLYTNYDEYNSHKNVRLGVAAISQELFNDERWFGKVYAGSFYQDVVGLYGELGYHLNSHFDLGFHTSYTYTSLFYDNKWYLGTPTMCNVMLKGSYYDPKLSLQVQVQGGRFMFGDWGGRMDLTKHFGEYAIGVYGILTGGEHNGGFHFAIPFGGKRQKRNGIIRVKAPEYYDMQYSMVSYWRYTWERMGREPEEVPDKNRSAHYWQAEYIEKYLQKILDGTFE